MFYGSPYYGAPSYGARRGPRHRGGTPPLDVTPIPPPPSLSSTGLCIAHSTNRGAPPMVGSRGFIVPCPPGVR